MAILARTAEGATMCIIASMTSKTGCRGCYFLNGSRLMTGVAGKALVRARECEFGLCVVIEYPELKAVWIVATRTDGT